MLTIRRALQIVALVGTLMVGIVALSLIVSQTPWFRDWLRRSIVRESKQYLNGELTIGGLTGNLLFGVGLTDVAVDVSGQRVIAVKALQVDYSVFQILSSGIVIDDLKLTAPVIHVERDANGWNLGRLVKKRAEEADRKGPGRPITLPAIELTDGTVTIDDKVGSAAYRLPSRIDALHVKGSFRYEPVHYSVTLDDVRFRGTSPDLTLQQLAGSLSVRDDNLYLEQLRLRTTESTATVGGVIQGYLHQPVLQVTTAGTVSLPEIGRVVPSLSGYALTPTFDVKGAGPPDRIAFDLNVQSQTGNVRGKMVADLKSPDLSFDGEVDLERLNAGPVLKAPAQRTDLTGHAKFALTLASAPDGAPALDRLRGTFGFTGPHAFAVGYQASDVRATGSIAHRKVTFDGRAAAYGGTGTAVGFVTIPPPNRPVAFDLRGRAGGIDLRRLPAITGAPKLASNLAASDYHVRGAEGRVQGSATLETSQLEGATLAQGTVAAFEIAKGSVSYSAKGQASNVDLQRVGRAFRIAALDKPEYDTRLNSVFDVRGAGRTLEQTTLDATGTLTDSDAWGAHFPQLTYETHLDRGALDARAKGRLERLDPARVSGNASLKGLVTGTADLHAQITDVTSPITLDDISADGTVALERSTLGDLEIESGAVDGRYGSRVGDLTRVTLSGPDVRADASGRIALDKTSSSNLTYHIEAADLGGARPPRGPGGGRRFGGSRRHAHRQRFVLGDHGNDEGERPGLPGEQCARRELAVHGDRAGSGVRERAREGDVGGDVRQGRSARAERGHGDHDLRGHAARLRCHGQARGARADRARRCHLSSRPSGDSSAVVSRAHPGYRVADGAGQRCGAALRERSNRAPGRQAGERRSRRSTSAARSP